MEFAKEVVLDEMRMVFIELVRNRFQSERVDLALESNLKAHMRYLILQGGHEVTREFHEELLETLHEVDPAAKQRLIERLSAHIHLA